MDLKEPLDLLIMTSALHTAQIAQLRGANRETALAAAEITLDMLTDSYKEASLPAAKAEVLGHIARLLDRGNQQLQQSVQPN